jgi:hypothetical protein
VLLLYLAVLVAMGALPRQVALAQAADLPVQGPASMSRDLFIHVLEEVGSPAASEGGVIYDDALTFGIDPAFALAVFARTSNYGEATLDPFDSPTYNWGGLLCRDYPRCNDTNKRVYGSWRDGATDFFRVIDAEHLTQGRTTVATIVPLYAPTTGDNDVATFERDVLAAMHAWRSGQITPPPPPEDSWFPSFDLDEMVNAPMDAAKYDVYRQLAQAGWQWTGSSFQFVDTLQGLRTKVLDVFDPLLNTIGVTLLDLSRYILVLGALVGGLALVIRPLMRLELVNLGTIFRLAVLLPLFLPLAGTMYAGAEGWRDDMAKAIYDTFFEDARTAPVLQPAAPPAPPASGQPPVMDIVDPFLPDGVARPSLDLSAAYVWAEYSDLQTTESRLPTKFEQQYFPEESEAVGLMDRAERQAALNRAWSGVLRQGTGMVLSLLPVADEVLRAIWMCGVTLLAVGVTVTAIWAVFAPGKRLLLVLGHELGTVFLLSMVFSGVQAFFVALVYVQANAALPGNTLASGILTILFLALLVVIAAGLVGLGLLHAVQVVTDDNKLAQRFTKVMGSRRSNAPALASQRDDEDTTSVAQRALAAVSAYRAGASKTWAASYAGSTLKPVQKSADVLMALGVMPAEAEHAVLAGNIANRGKLSGMRARSMLRNQVAHSIEQRYERAQLPQLIGAAAVLKLAKQRDLDRRREEETEKERARLRNEAELQEKWDAKQRRAAQNAANHGKQRVP